MFFVRRQPVCAEHVLNGYVLCADKCVDRLTGKTILVFTAVNSQQIGDRLVIVSKNTTELSQSADM